jgi:hypothetical protein
MFPKLIGSAPLKRFLLRDRENIDLGREGSEPLNKLFPNSRKFKFGFEIDEGSVPAIEFSPRDKEFNVDKFPISSGSVPVKLQDVNVKDET